jgi:hypothetical protein
VLTFFIAGLLYLLCLKHVDNLGAYSIPSGDRPSHPNSVIGSYAGNGVCAQIAVSNYDMRKIVFDMLSTTDESKYEKLFSFDMAGSLSGIMRVASKSCKASASPCCEVFNISRTAGQRGAFPRLSLLSSPLSITAICFVLLWRLARVLDLTVNQEVVLPA